MSGRTYQPSRGKAVTPAQAAVLQRACACGNHALGEGECEDCRAGRSAQLQRRSAGPALQDYAPPAVHETLRSPGQVLDAPTRREMEQRLGHDFSRVRVHTDPAAAQSAQAVNALAYTVGQHVVFGAGHFAPATDAGRRLLAHELAHVVQQAGAAYPTASTIRVDHPGSAQEHEAHQVAAQLPVSARLPYSGSLPVAQRAGLQLNRAPCYDAEKCKQIEGGAGKFIEDVGKAEKPKKEKFKKMTSKQAAAAGHGVQASSLEKFFEAQAPGARRNIHGIFVSQTIVKDRVAAEMAYNCADAVPSVTDPAVHYCMLVPDTLEKQAKEYDSNKAAKKIGSQTREDWRVSTLQTLTHEVQHAKYGKFTRRRLLPPPGTTCSRVDHMQELSELSAIISEFQPAFASMPAETRNKTLAKDQDYGELAKSSPEYRRLVQWFKFAVTNPSESILGTLDTLRCSCSCDDVNTYILETYNITTASWTQQEKLFFTKLMKSPTLDKLGANWPITEAQVSSAAQKQSGSDYERYGKGDSCDKLCMSLESIRNSADKICDLAGESDKKCTDAQLTLTNNKRKIFESGCKCQVY